MSKLPRKKGQTCRRSPEHLFSNAPFTVVDHSTRHFNSNTDVSPPERNCLSQHAPHVTSLSSHIFYSVHLVEAVSDDVKGVERVPSVTDYLSPHPPQHVQGNEVVSDDDKGNDTRENVVLRSTVFSEPPFNSNVYSSKKETEDEAFMIPYVNEFNSSFDIFERIDNDFFNEEQPDKSPFHNFIEEEKSQTSMDELERALSIVCSLPKFMDRLSFFEIISFYGKARYTVKQYGRRVIIKQD